MTQVVASEKHQKCSNEFVRFFLPLLNEIAFDIVDDFLAFVLHLVEFVLQPKLFLLQERDVEFLGGVAALKIPSDVQIVIFDDARDNRRC